jgi:2-polyprenyl-3-methyl-5-hydroxy-6-metoxy-1,4-benzoquinol methylase
MEPAQTGKAYDALAQWWSEQHRDSGYGVKQLERAISFSQEIGKALDVGCGSAGRFMRVLNTAGFEVEGLDVSQEMLNLAEKELPECRYICGDVSEVEIDEGYQFISAWDSTFHLPLDAQGPVLKKLCDALCPNGILVYPTGGTSDQEEVSGSFEGQDFEYSTLGLSKNLELLAEYHCECVHLEFDQGASEKHVYIIAKKRG